jgi:16S rRNA (cytosine967-C5)-methyltransferase
MATRDLASVARGFSLSPEDRALARELVAGVERRRGTLDAVIAAYVPSRGFDRDLRIALRVGLYQVLFLERVPAHAAVDETVGIVRARRGPRGAGFVNAVLRSVLREGAEEAAGGGAPDPRRTLEVGARRFRFGRDVFPDPNEDRAGHLAAVHSHPRFLVGRWLERFGAETAREVLEAGNRVPPLALRANRMRTTRAELLRWLRSLGFAARPGRHPLAVRVEPGARGLLDSEPFRKGHFAVQDETAMEAVDLLGPRPGERILDLCAAPGGKTTQIAEAVGDQAEILASDVSEEGLARLRENLTRLGLHSVETRLRAPDGGEPRERDFDRVLVDAPCSNTGVLARRPEARWRLSAATLRGITALQRRCLRAGLRALKPGGRLVYSTCAVEPEENGELLRGVLPEAPGVEIREERLSLPGPDRDGGYAAAVERARG